MRFRFSRPRRPRPRHLLAMAFGVIAAVGTVVLPLPVLDPSVVTTDLFIVRETDEPFDEDVYVVSSSGRVEGVIDGDLVIFTGDLTISGTITGDVTVLSFGRVLVDDSGVVEGSVRGAARDVTVRGSVADDVAVVALSMTIADGAPATQVGRDAITFSFNSSVDGTLQRDLRGRMVFTGIDGAVGGDVDITVASLSVGSNADVGGDVVYRSSREASINEGATIEGQVVRLPAQSNFIVGVVLTVANIISFLAFLLAGLAVIWLFRETAPRAVGTVLARPWRTLGVGALATLLGPVAVVLLAVTLVGLPIALLAAFGMLLGLIFAPVAAVAALGERILRGRGGLFGAFLLGALLWRAAIWLIPVVGALVYVVGFVWGLGGWLVAAWEQRHREQPAPLLPSSMLVAEKTAEEAEWEPPLPPAAPLPTETDDPRPGAEAEPPRVEPPPADEPTDADPDDWGLPRPPHNGDDADSPSAG